MSDDDHYTEIDISDVIDDSENYFENENQSEIIETELNSIQNSEIFNSEEQIPPEKKIQNAKSEPVVRSTRLPMARIKNIMKMDPDVHIVNAEAVFLVTKATEMFLESIAKETFTYTTHHKRKTISKKDLDVIINKVDCLCFLEGAMDF
ncbi:DNA polymerase epsilon subunit 4 [Zerene cesonia]|uniref:DNA polymerase epsilon subunit 4 n=1 Tax=Zerene cesonia TaxID=33412 RepID=UPI0018E4EF07|nr:DNA polymerase epsilon subunit 4 [Zerene cesonia]